MRRHAPDTPEATAMTQRKLSIVLYLATYGGCLVVAASALSDGDARKAIAWFVLAALWATGALLLSRDPQPKKPPAA